MRTIGMVAISALLLALGVVPSGGSVTIVADLVNVAPVITSVSVVSGLTSGAVTPAIGGTASIGVSVVVTDNNGASNIDTIQMLLLKPDGTTLQTFSVSNPPDSTGALTATYTARTVTVPFYAAPAAGYKVRAQATDGNGAVSNLAAAPATSSSFTVNTVLGLSAPTSVDLGSGGLTPGVAGSIQTMTVTNAGNVLLDIAVSSAGLTSGGNTIPSSAIDVGLNSGLSDAATLAAQRTLNSDVAIGAASSTPVYVRLTPPTGLPSGSYSGSLTATAVQG